MRYGPFWHDSVWVDVDMALEVMSLDAIEVGSILETRVVPVEVLHPPVDVGITISDGSIVAFEVGIVNRVEPNDCSVQPDVGLGELVSVQIGPAILQHLFDAIEAVEQRLDVGLVRCLGGCEATFVNTIVDGWIDPLVECINLLGELLRVESDTSQLLGDEIVKAVVEVTNHLARFVVDNRVELVVPDDGHSATLRVVGVSGEVEVSDSFLVLVTGDLDTGTGNTVAFRLFIRHKAPTFAAEE